MTIWKTIVPTGDGDYVTVDTIEYDGGLWLVPEWLPGPSPAMRKPARLIRIDSLSHQDVGGGEDGMKRSCILHDAIPKFVLGGSASPGALRIVVIEAPELFLRIDGDE